MLNVKIYFYIIKLKLYMKTFEIRFSDKIFFESQPTQSTYRTHHIAKCYARMALDFSLSRIILIKHFRKPGKLRISVYKILGDPECFRVLYIGCQNYKKYLNILTIQKSYRKKYL